MTTQELDALLAAHFAGTLDAAGQKQLADALLSDESARRRFVELSDQEAALRTMAAAQRLPVPGSSFLVPGSEYGGPSAKGDAEPDRSTIPEPGTRNQEPGTPARRRAGWLIPAAAAAAIIVVSGLFASGILPSGSVTLKEFDNTSGAVVERTLSDGTRLSLAPGAKLAAAGRDDSRRIRQLIKLESGEVEVKAPRAAAGEIACRVETPEGLWVETMGAVFRVTHTWENERGERNADRSKLTGSPLTAVLLVAVTDGEVRTGRGFVEEDKVAAGGEAAVRAAGKPEGEKALAWGQAENGLRARLIPENPVLATDGVGLFRVRLELQNVSTKRVSLLAEYPQAVKVSVTAPDGKEVKPTSFGPHGLGTPTWLRVKAGQVQRMPLTSEKVVLGFRFIPGKPIGILCTCADDWHLPAGKYLVSASYSGEAWKKLDDNPADAWSGVVLTPAVEIEVKTAVSRGQAAGGLQAGLSAKPGTFAAGKPVLLSAHLSNVGQYPLLLQNARDFSRWSVVFRPTDGGPPVDAQVKFLAERTSEPSVSLAAGQSLTLEMLAQPFTGSGLVGLKDPMLSALPPGKYTVSASYQDGERREDKITSTLQAQGLWTGKISTGPVEIEIIEPGKAATAPSFSAKPRRLEDKVVPELVAGVLVLTVTSPGGIGSAEVKPEKGEWPKKIAVRLALKGLEGFSAECGGKKLSGRLGAAGKDELAAEKKGVFIEVALPEGFASGADAVLKISWVDFYR